MCALRVECVQRSSALRIHEGENPATARPPMTTVGNETLPVSKGARHLGIDVSHMGGTLAFAHFQMMCTMHRVLACSEYGRSN